MVPRSNAPTIATYLKGALFGLAAVSIWAGWSALTRLAVTTRRDAWDIAGLRFGIAGCLLAPLAVRRGLALDQLGWSGLALLIAGAGVPYVLLAAAGLQFAPAHDQGALNPGFMPLFVALISALGLGEKLAAARQLGLSVILVGALIIVGSHAATWSTSRLCGDALFLSAALLWAGFTVVMQQARIDPLHAAALISCGSALIYLPIYLVFYGAHFAQIPLADVVLQAIFQGLLVTVVSLVLYGRAIALIGASGGAAFGALVPALSALIAMPLLGEWPSLSDWVGIGLISSGVYLASGGPISLRRAGRQVKSTPEPRRRARKVRSVRPSVGPEEGESVPKMREEAMRR
jgi:drug/metabolite transporter (DMT)-like permease